MYLLLKTLSSGHNEKQYIVQSKICNQTCLKENDKYYYYLNQHIKLLQNMLFMINKCFKSQNKWSMTVKGNSLSECYLHVLHTENVT